MCVIQFPFSCSPTSTDHICKKYQQNQIGKWTLPYLDVVIRSACVDCSIKYVGSPICVHY